MGPMYGWQWRNFGGVYFDCDNYTSGYDQLKNVIDLIKTDPSSRRIMMVDFNPSQLKQSVLAPCHSIVIQFYVDGDYLDCTMYQRSADIFLGVPFNIASTSLLLRLIADLTYKTPRFVHIEFGDVHLYEQHVKSAETQLKQQI